MSTKHTPGPWQVPHFADPKCKCKCAYVLVEQYCGCICTVDIGNELPIGEGGNDSPPLEEAIANAHLIASAPDMLAILLRIQADPVWRTNDNTLWRDIGNTIMKAEGRAP